MKNRLVLLSIGLVVALSLLAVWVYRSERQHVEEIMRQDEQPVEAALEPETSSDTRELSFYVVNPDASNPGGFDLRRVSEQFGVSDDAILATQIVSRVLRNTAFLHGDGGVRQVYILENGTAVVDLSRRAFEGRQLGIAVEFGLLQSITRSLRENLEQVSEVRFVVDGNASATLYGHVSLSDPFR